MRGFFTTCYLFWLFEAKKRFGLCALDYIVTSNHVHLFVNDIDLDIAESAADAHESARV